MSSRRCGLSRSSKAPRFSPDGRFPRRPCCAGSSAPPSPPMRATSSSRSRRRRWPVSSMTGSSFKRRRFTAPRPACSRRAARPRATLRWLPPKSKACYGPVPPLSGTLFTNRRNYMSRKHSLPNVDEEALAALARQFPSMNARPEDRDEPTLGPPANGPQAAPKAVQQPAPDRGFAADRTPMASVEPSAMAEQRGRRRGGGRLLALIAVLIALGALAVALGPAAPPQLRAWLAAQIDAPDVVDVLTGNRAELDARLAAVADGMKALADRQAQIGARLAAVQAVGGSSDGAARRVAAGEDGHKRGGATRGTNGGAGKTAPIPSRKPGARG